MSDIFDRLTKLRKDKDDIDKAFRKTEVWKAVFEHLKDSKNCILVEVAEGSRVCCYRGTGYAIRTESITPVRLLNKSDSFDNFIRCDISVTFYPDDYTNDEETGNFTLDIPEALASEFNKDDFDKWALEVKRLRDERLHANEIYTLKRLMKKYPQVVKESENAAL